MIFRLYFLIQPIFFFDSFRILKRNQLVKNLTSDAFAAAILAKIKNGQTSTNPSDYGDTGAKSSSSRMVDDVDEVRQNPIPYG